ncbi:hypothetical protein A2U01_0099166, partial [Trifolium medium]|nr:hypothetical protein [Trifolium medium]
RVRRCSVQAPVEAEGGCVSADTPTLKSVKCGVKVLCG